MSSYNCDCVRYMLTVVATDLSSEPRSSNITVVITVQDENDNDPTILNIVSRVTRVSIEEVSNTFTAL